jgi:hypothetical protein
MKTVPAVQVVTAEDAAQEPLPPRVQEALGQLVGAAKEGLLALSVGVGLGVLAELMEEEATRSSARRASTTLTASPCATAMRRVG